MTPIGFCYWLMGMLNGHDEYITTKKLSTIKDMLARLLADYEGRHNKAPRTGRDL